MGRREEKRVANNVFFFFLPYFHVTDFCIKNSSVLSFCLSLHFFYTSGIEFVQCCLLFTLFDRVDKKKKNHHKNYQENYENGGNGAYLQDYSAHLGRSDRASASNEARYNDMAPK